MNRVQNFLSPLSLSMYNYANHFADYSLSFGFPLSLFNYFPFREPRTRHGYRRNASIAFYLNWQMSMSHPMDIYGLDQASIPELHIISVECSKSIPKGRGIRGHLDGHSRDDEMKPSKD